MSWLFCFGHAAQAGSAGTVFCLNMEKNVVTDRSAQKCTSTSMACINGLDGSAETYGELFCVSLNLTLILHHLLIMLGVTTPSMIISCQPQCQPSSKAFQ